MKIIYNKHEILDKIKACWLGKNIGGTIGAPYEWQREFAEVTGFATECGEPAPNDDIDLQLIWLMAMENEGPGGVNSSVLGEYWITNIPPYWNEYGNSKANMQIGILPPLSGEYKNDRWKTSNGAWIRSEIWACLSPGVDEIALKYAMMDASVDHGISDGTYAEIFTAALECNAFFESDIRKNIEHALEKIPTDCKIAKAVSIAIKCYEDKIPIKEARDLLIEQFKDIGWFQAPTNLGFVILGLLYGEGNFKKSVLYTVNCGDDTDCTAGTVGAIMGIMHGTKIIPDDWLEYIGDKIITKATNGSECNLPKNCRELIDRIFKLIPTVVGYAGIHVEISDEADTMFEGSIAPEIARREQLFDITKLYRTPNSYDVIDDTVMYGYVEFDSAPAIRSNEEITARLKLINRHRDSRQLMFKVFLPEGWSAEYSKTSYMKQNYVELLSYVRTESECDYDCEWTVKITPNENISAINRIPVEITVSGRPTAIYFPIVLIG